MWTLYHIWSLEYDFILRFFPLNSMFTLHALLDFIPPTLLPPSHTPHTHQIAPHYSTHSTLRITYPTHPALYVPHSPCTTLTPLTLHYTYPTHPALHVPQVAASPLYLKPDQVPESTIATETAIFRYVT
jgi:hypothetical protein